MKTDLLRFQLLTNSYQKYLQFLDEIDFTLNENNIQLNNEFRDKISELSLNYTENCFVFIDNNNENPQKGNEIQYFWKTFLICFLYLGLKRVDNFNAEEVSDNVCNDFGINYTYESNNYEIQYFWKTFLKFFIDYRLN